MSEPIDAEQTNDYSDGDDPVVPPTKPHTAHHPENPVQPHKADAHTQQESQRVSKRRRRKAKAYWRKFCQAGADRHIELVIAAAVLVFVILQYRMTSSNNESTSRQVDRIISAANEIKSAAWVFSGAAQGINNATWQAVGQLGAQAGASQTLAGITASEFSFNRQVADSQRAAISVEFARVLNPVTFHDRGLSEAFSVWLINNGQTKANNIVMRFKMHYVQWGDDYFHVPPKRQAELCDKPPTDDEVRLAKDATDGGVIFAGGHTERQINFGMGAPVASEIIKWPPDSAYVGDPTLKTPQTDRVNPFVVGCIDYTSGSVAGKHQVGFIFDIQKTSEDGSLPTFIKLGEDVPLQKVVITKFFFTQGKNF
jgi:hypothetical protein